MLFDGSCSSILVVIFIVSMVEEDRGFSLCIVAFDVEFTAVLFSGLASWVELECWITFVVSRFLGCLGVSVGMFCSVSERVT